MNEKTMEKHMVNLMWRQMADMISWWQNNQESTPMPQFLEESVGFSIPLICKLWEELEKKEMELLGMRVKVSASNDLQKRQDTDDPEDVVAEYFPGNNDREEPTQAEIDALLEKAYIAIEGLWARFDTLSANFQELWEETMEVDYVYRHGV